MLVIGLTGGIGSGKTAVSSLFNKLGVPVIDTDIIARELVNNDPVVLKEITVNFGRNVLDDDGTLNRKRLAQIVFHNAQDKKRLENILHPRIRNETADRIKSYKSENRPPDYVIVVIPLLLETGFKDLVDRILVVVSDEKTRIKRIEHRDNRNTDEIRAIINSQVSDETRLNEADDINIKRKESNVYVNKLEIKK